MEEPRRLCRPVEQRARKRSSNAKVNVGITGDRTCDVLDPVIRRPRNVEPVLGLQRCRLQYRPRSRVTGRDHGLVGQDKQLGAFALSPPDLTNRGDAVRHLDRKEANDELTRSFGRDHADAKRSERAGDVEDFVSSDERERDGELAHVAITVCDYGI